MKKPNKTGLSSSASNPTPTIKQHVANPSKDHTSIEQQALALANQGQLQQAETIYRNLIGAGTHNYIVYMNLATICGMQGRFDELIDLLKKTLELNPDDPDSNYKLGKALQEQGDLNAAIDSYKQAIQLKPNYPDALNNLGTALKQQGDLNAAIDSYKQAIQLKPSSPELLNNLGTALKQQGDLNAAIDSYNKALSLKPNFQEAHYNLGNVLKEQGDLNAAINSYKQAIQLNPNYPDALYNLGNALKQQGDLNAAIDSYKQAIQLNPNWPEVLNNLGTALMEQGNLNAAIDSFKKALSLKPNYPEAHWNSSLTMLLGGDYKSGWGKYEWRSKKKDPILPSAHPNCSQWKGKPLNAKDQLLLVSEQGLGDTLQFMRYALALRNQGIAVSLCAPPRLHSLIQSSGIADSPLTPEQANKVSEGQWSPLLSVPRHLDVSPDNPIITEPYVKTSDELITKWKDILSVEQRPIVGINWQGNRSDITKKERNVALEEFATIANSRNITLISLQRGARFDEIESCSFSASFTKKQPNINEIANSDLDLDFIKYAAIIANCDLIITTATTLAHLAGGMGKRTWTLIPSSPDWRWGLKGDTSFWYPSMRLFRQKERSVWAEVLQRVAGAIDTEFPNQ